MKDRQYEELLSSLAANATHIQVDGLTVELRNCFDRKPGELDPRTAVAARLTRAELIAHPGDYHPELLSNADHLFGPEAPEGYSELELLRFQFGWRSTDLSKGVDTQRVQIDTPHGKIIVWRYEVPSTRTNRPCLIFFHGGGFFAGDTETVQNQCRLIAQMADAVVLQPDYLLAPEHPFPAGFDCCYSTLEWAHANAAELGIDSGKIGLSGDSAGGNLAIVCTLRSRDEGKDLVRYLAPIYPTLSRASGPEDPHYFWRREAYDIAEDDPYIEDQIRTIGESNHLLNGWYLTPDTDPFDPYVSPMAGSCDGLPKTLIMVAEYDYLRLECEEYSRRLLAAGNDHRHIRYGGIVHGTFDRLGYAHQVEDMLIEIAKDLKSL